MLTCEIGSSSAVSESPASGSSPLQDSSFLISHELRNPLASIQGALGLLETGQFGQLSEEGTQLLSIALRNANRLTRLASAIEQQPQPLSSMLSAAELQLLQLENELYQGLSEHEFFLSYQPIVAVEQDAILGFEALARWRHPTRGLISPAAFVPLAEKTGLIHQLGLWLLEQACRQLRQWQQAFPQAAPIVMSVNISTVQLAKPDLVSQIERILRLTEIAPGSLKLEITESALIENHAIALETLRALKALGVQLYLDDFGTGYSSLSRLQNLPLDALKIDRSFVRDKNWTISEAILLLAEKLNLDVIAEGIETPEDLSSLKSIGCKQMQGYFFSKPIDGLAASALLKRPSH